jgi:site-specific DNA-methyltransferase (adenine-specific)
VHILDRIFGEKNFRNEIAWCYYSPSSPLIKQLPRKHDTIFWYSKGNKWTFNKDDSRVPFKDDKQTLRKRWGDDLSEEKVKEYREKGKVIEDFWTDIIQIGRSKAEIIGYPTQKPEALMERIIKMTSNEGDLVLDPFMGGGTTAAAADRLHRRWIGIDQSAEAVKVTESRLRQQGGNFDTIMANTVASLPIKNDHVRHVYSRQSSHSRR